MFNLFTVIGDPHIVSKVLHLGRRLFDLVEFKGHPAIWLGDFLDTKEIIRGKCLNLIYDYFLSSKLEHIIIIGNHDYFNLECLDHSLKVLNSLPNVTIVDKRTELHGMHFIPYIHDLKVLKDELKQIPKDSVLFGHLEVQSFDFGNGHMCEAGLTTKSLNKFKRVISGHFHKYQQRGNLTYLGTPFSHSFGESDQIKYIGVYDKSKDELALEETNFPSHKTITVDCDVNNSVNVDVKPDDHVRLILTGSQQSIDKVKSSLSVSEDVRVLTRPTDTVLDMVIDENATNESQFQEWAKNVKQLDQETVDLGLQILGAVK